MMKRVFRIVTNKFFIVGAAFVVWMIYFDQNNWTSQQERDQELKETERHIDYLKEQISRMEYEHHQLKTNPDHLERYAREKYKLKKDNEDVYIIER